MTPRTPPPKNVSISLPFASPGASITSASHQPGVAEAWLHCPGMVGTELINSVKAGRHIGQRTSIHQRFLIDSLANNEDLGANWDADTNTLHILRRVPVWYANPNNQDDYVTDDTTGKPMYPSSHPLLGSMASCQTAKKIDGEVSSPGKIVYEQAMDPDSVDFYLQPIDATLGKSNGQVLIVAMDVYVPKEVKKGKIVAKKRSNAARVDLGTLLEDLVMDDASDGTTGVAADGTGDTTTTPTPGECAAGTATTIIPPDAVTTTTTAPPAAAAMDATALSAGAAMDATAPPAGAAMDATAPPVSPGVAAGNAGTAALGVETSRQRTSRQTIRALSPRRRRSKRNKKQRQSNRTRASPTSSSLPPILKGNKFDVDDDDAISL